MSRKVFFIFFSLSIGVILLLIEEGCAIPQTAPGQRENIYTRSIPSLTLFDKLWSERTIVLGGRVPGGGVPQMPVLGIGGGGENIAPFPMSVRATLMDSTLISEGVREFGKLASMNIIELAHFDSLYRVEHNSDGFLYVWAEFRTSSTEDFLQLDRWTIYMENDQGRQLEPERVVASPVRKEQGFSMNDYGANDQQRGMRQGSGVWTPSVREVEFYFPVRRKGGETFLAEGERTLKFIILENKNPAVRAEGIWSTFR